MGFKAAVLEKGVRAVRRSRRVVIAFAESKRRRRFGPESVDASWRPPVKRSKMRMGKVSRKTDAPPATGRRDGSSFECAILIDQNRWRAQDCAGAKLLLQKLQGHDGRYFDVLLLELTSGEVREVYFDLTETFKRLISWDSDSQNDDAGSQWRCRRSVVRGMTAGPSGRRERDSA
jgi:hypothetical protein